MLELTDETFDDVVKRGICVVDFWSTNCIPCKIVTPALEELSLEYAGKATFATVDVDTQMKTAFKNRVLGIPTVIYFVDGRPMDVLYASYPKRVYEERLLKLIQTEPATASISV
jgi:thioredoxin 1